VDRRSGSHKLMGGTLSQTEKKIHGKEKYVETPENHQVFFSGIIPFLAEDDSFKYSENPKESDERE